MTASPPARPAAAEPPTMSGAFARETARESALPAARVPATAALPARAALAVASIGVATSFDAFRGPCFARDPAGFLVFVAWAIDISRSLPLSMGRLPRTRAGKRVVDGLQPERKGERSQPPSEGACA